MSAPRSPHAAPLALQDAQTSVRWAARIARHGGRVFTGAGGMLLLALPAADAPEALHVLVPRGMGKPLLARRARSGFVCATSGAPCAPARWHDAGAVVAHVRRAPSRCQDAPITEGGAIVALHVGNPALGVGDDGEAPAAAISHGRVLGANKRARALGVARGMRARDLPVGILRRPAVAVHETLRAVCAWVAQRLPRGASVGVAAHAGRPYVQVAGVDAGAAGPLVAAAWQRLGVELRAGVAADANAAATLARLTGTGTVAVGTGHAVHGGTHANAARWRTGRHHAEWAGPALPDLGGAAHRAAALARAVHAAGACTLRIDGERGRRTLRLPLPADLAVREAMVRTTVERAAFGLGGVHRVRVRTGSVPETHAARTCAQQTHVQQAHVQPTHAKQTHPQPPAGGPAQVPLFRMAA